MIGISEHFEGEEIRMGKFEKLTDTKATADTELGRILTMPFMPADYALNACGMQLCDAQTLDEGQSKDFDCVYENADFGGCGSICNLHKGEDAAAGQHEAGAHHSQWSGHSCKSDACSCSGSKYPKTLAIYIDDNKPNKYVNAHYGNEGDLKAKYGTPVTAEPKLKGGYPCTLSDAAKAAGKQDVCNTGNVLKDNDKGKCLGYKHENEKWVVGKPDCVYKRLGRDSAVECQKLCAANAKCKHWYAWPMQHKPVWN